MEPSTIARPLCHEQVKLVIIDVHEYLTSEKPYIEDEYNRLNFFAGYIRNDILKNGSFEKFRPALMNSDCKSIKGWRPKIMPRSKAIRNTIFVRLAFTDARSLPGINDIKDIAIKKQALQVIVDNEPELYSGILMEKGAAGNSGYYFC